MPQQINFEVSMDCLGFRIGSYARAAPTSEAVADVLRITEDQGTRRSVELHRGFYGLPRFLWSCDQCFPKLTGPAPNRQGGHI